MDAYSTAQKFSTCQTEMFCFRKTKAPRAIKLIVRSINYFFD